MAVGFEGGDGAAVGVVGEFEAGAVVVEQPEQDAAFGDHDGGLDGGVDDVAGVEAAGDFAGHDQDGA